MRFRWYVSVAWLMILLILSVASMGNTVYAQIGPGDSVCVENEVEITPYSLNGWEVSNDYNGTFNSSYMFTPDGLEITNPENLARTRAMKVVNKPLSEIDSLGYVRTGAASYQLEATGWTDGQTFATLVWEEIYNPSTGVYDGYWWRTGSALGVPNGVNSPTPYETRHQVTLPMILAANPSLQILRYGVSLGSYQPGTSVIESIEFDCETSTFVAEPLACDEITGPTVATFENRMGWDLDTDTRSAGEYEFVAPEGSLPGGLLIHTTNSPATSQDKVAGYLPVNVHLKDIGSTADLLLEYHPIDGYPSTPPPGLQIKIDLDNNGTFDGYMAYEPTYYPDIWWSNSINTTTFPGLPAGGGGYPVGGPLYEVLDAYPDAHILAIGFSLGSGVFGGGIIETMTIACHEYRFAPDEVEPDAPTFNDPTCDNQAASITFPESEIFQYQVTGSTMPGGSVQVTASLKPGVKNKVATGTLVWNHTFATIDSLNCPVAVTPEEPMVDSIETCGEEGSVTFATTEGVTYSRQPLNNVEGLVTVSATANDGYVLQDYDGHGPTTSVILKNV